MISDSTSAASRDDASRQRQRLVLLQSEIDILQMVRAGSTNKEIAQHLAISVPMVKWRTNRLFSKLHVRNRVQAVARVGQIAPTLLGTALGPVGPMPESPTNAERQILHLLSFGLTNRQIAGSLNMKLGTVRWYMGELFGKLQARNRVEALARARQQSWV